MQVHLIVLILPSRAAALVPVARDRHLPMATLRLAVNPPESTSHAQAHDAVLLNPCAGFAQGWFFWVDGLGGVLGHASDFECGG
jgi:hypothetical protein